MKEEEIEIDKQKVKGIIDKLVYENTDKDCKCSHCYGFNLLAKKLKKELGLE